MELDTDATWTNAGRRQPRCALVVAASALAAVLAGCGPTPPTSGATTGSTGGFGLSEVWDPDDGAYPGDPCGITSPTMDRAPAVVLTPPGLMLPAPTGDTDVDWVLATTRVASPPVDPAASPVRVVTVPGGSSLLVATADLAEPQAGGFVPGRLGVVDGGCVGLAEEGFGELMVWPRGTTALPGGSGVEAPGFGVVRFGDDLVLSTSTRYMAALDPTSRALADVPRTCLDGVDRFGVVEREQPYQDDAGSFDG